MVISVSASTLSFKTNVVYTINFYIFHFFSPSFPLSPDTHLPAHPPMPINTVNTIYKQTPIKHSTLTHTLSLSHTHTHTYTHTHSHTHSLSHTHIHTHTQTLTHTHTLTLVGQQPLFCASIRHEAPPGVAVAAGSRCSRTSPLGRGCGRPHVPHARLRCERRSQGAPTWGEPPAWWWWLHKSGWGCQGSRTPASCPVQTHALRSPGGWKQSMYAILGGGGGGSFQNVQQQIRFSLKLMLFAVLGDENKACTQYWGEEGERESLISSKSDSLSFLFFFICKRFELSQWPWLSRQHTKHFAWHPKPTVVFNRTKCGCRMFCNSADTELILGNDNFYCTWHCRQHYKCLKTTLQLMVLQKIYIPVIGSQENHPTEMCYKKITPQILAKSWPCETGFSPLNFTANPTLK